MSIKNNIRSFRYSDEVAGVLEAFEGSSLNDKFENLVLYCFWERERIEKQIGHSRDLLKDVESKIADRRRELYDLDALCRERRLLASGFSRLSELMSAYADALEKDVTQRDLAGELPGQQKCVTKTKTPT